jgi:hypothetical protein
MPITTIGYHDIENPLTKVWKNLDLAYILNANPIYNQSNRKDSLELPVSNIDGGV